MRTIAMIALIAGTTGSALAGQVTVRYTPFQTGSGGEFRIEQVGNRYAGEINKYSDVSGTITANNVEVGGKTLQNTSGDFFTNFSRGANASQINTSNANRAINDFQTFCIERSETVANNTTYTFEIGMKAINGGNGNGPEPGTHDTLGDQAAWLYFNFRHGTLSGYNMWGNTVTEAMRESSAKTLQHVLWYFENELGGANSNQDTSLALSGLFVSNPNSLTASEQTQATTWAQAALNAVNAGWVNTSVRVLNLFIDNNNNGVYDAGDTLAQTQLTLIPLPTAGGLACIGLLGIGLRTRRRSL